jgi:ATP synthase protein I
MNINFLQNKSYFLKKTGLILLTKNIGMFVLHQSKQDVLESVLSKVKRNTTQLVFAYSTIGLQLAGTLLICVYTGNWLDRHYNTQPWFLLAGAALGMIGGFFNMFRELNAMQRSTEEIKGEKTKRRKWL